MLSDDDLADLVMFFPALRGLAPDELGALRTDAETLLAPAGTMLADEGAPCERFGMVISGEIRVLATDGNGRSLLLYQMGPGDACALGVRCLMEHGRYPARAVASTAIRSVWLPRSRFETLLGTAPDFRRFVLGLLSNRLGDVIDRVGDAAFRRVEQRLAARLVTSIPSLAATHRQLAEEVGAAREVITRTLRQFERAGYVRLGRGRVDVCAPEELRTVAARR